MSDGERDVGNGERERERGERNMNNSGSSSRKSSSRNVIIKERRCVNEDENERECVLS